jgi:hypothetical protein
VVNTDAEGTFFVPNLPPATYSVRVELSGFATAELKELVLRNGEVSRPTITLGLANVAETVTVVGLSPLLQTTNASVSQTITQKQIEDLPVAGRGLLSFASLSAGVTPQAFNRGTQFGAAGSSRSQYVTVEGGRDSSTNYAIDGVYVRSLRFNNMSLNPPLDAVQEVNVLRNSFTTEYGQGPGGRLDRDEIRIESPDRFRVRLHPQSEGRGGELLRAEARRPDAGRCHGRRTDRQESLLRVWRL